MSTDQAHSLEGAMLGKYRVIRRVGAGNMATVYMAHDPFIDRPVAIKVARSEHLEDGQHGALYRQLFFNEAQTAGLLKHPNITAIYDAGIDDGHYYIVMEYVHGGATLERHTRPATLLPVETVTALVYQCAMALDYAHRRGVVHRDIKPRNILLTEDGEAKITDFGVAVTPDLLRDEPPDHAGSPLYMSPEQIRREPAAPQSDLFSLGVVTYELLTGRHPFHGENLEAIEHRILQGAPSRLANLNADIPDIYQRIIDKALAKSRTRRYHSCRDMAGDLTLVYDFLSLPAARISREQKYRQVEQVAFFRELPEAERWELINAADWLRVEAGDPVRREDDEAPAYLIVLSGRAQVRRPGRQPLTLGPGDCFGERGPVDTSTGASTLYACDDFSAMRLRVTTVERMSINAQLHFQRHFLEALIDRLGTTGMAAVPADETG